MVGVGNWGRHILRDLITLGCSVHAVARSEQSIMRAKDAGATSIVASVEELPELDGAVVATIATKHAEAIAQVAERTAGPIFCEKPLTANVAEAERLAAALPQRLFVMDKWRYHPGVRELARLARSGQLGEVRSVALRRVTHRNPHPDVNTLWTHLPHDFAILLEVCGEIPPLASLVSEWVANELRGATMALGGERSPQSTIEISDCAPDHRRECRVVGSEAVAILDGGWSEHVTVRDFKHDDWQIATPGELPLRAELRAFVDHVGGGPAPKSSAAEGLLVVRRVQEVVDRAYEIAGVGQ